MKRIILPAIFGTLGLFVFGCAAARTSSVTSNQDWLDEAHIKSAATRWGYLTRTNFDAYYINVLQLQQQADVMFEVTDQQNMEVTTVDLLVHYGWRLPDSGHGKKPAVVAVNRFPKGKFPIADLAKYFPHGSHHQSFEMVVIIIPPEFSEEPGKPDLLAIMQNIDKVLVASGVKRRVFEELSDYGWMKLDSAEPN